MDQNEDFTAVGDGPEAMAGEPSATGGSGERGPKTKSGVLAVAVIAIAAAIAAFSFLGAGREQAPLAPEEKDASGLAEVYFKYQGVTTVDGLKEFRAAEPDDLEQIDGLTKEERDQAAAFMVAFRPRSPEIVSEIIEGDKGVLAVQGFSNPGRITFDESKVPEGYAVAEKKPIETRQYQLVLFKKMDGEWKIYKDMSFEYSDPRPAMVKIGQAPYEGDPQRHCNFATTAASCPASDASVMQPNECFECFAKLTLDPSLCDSKASDLERQDPEFFKDFIASSRNGCKRSVAPLVGDPVLCAALPEKNSFGQNERESCLNSIEGHDFLAGTNIYNLDSDKDGLTDMLEIRFFNTSAGVRDTDGDGASDKAEVDAMTNPLGTGRLGDHLK